MGRKRGAAGGAPKSGEAGEAADVGGGDAGGQGQGVNRIGNHASTFTGALPGVSMFANMMLQSMVQPVRNEKHPTTIDPDVADLCDHFHIEPWNRDRLDWLMKGRQETFEADMLRLWEVLESARSPAGMLVAKMQEMDQGLFVGVITPDKGLAKIIKKYELDKIAAGKLADVMQLRKDTYQEDLKQLDKHLASSGKPSARVMMMLKRLRDDPKVLEDPTQRPQQGSYADVHGNDSGDARGSGDKGESDRRGDGDRDRRGDWDRDRDRNRDDDRRQSDRYADNNKSDSSAAWGNERDRRDSWDRDKQGDWNRDRDKQGDSWGGSWGRDRDRPQANESWGSGGDSDRRGSWDQDRRGDWDRDRDRDRGRDRSRSPPRERW